MNEKNSNKRRINILPVETSTSIRAGQVIGSISRAIEELCRNSIVHGHATDISVTIGDCYYDHPTNSKESSLAVVIPTPLSEMSKQNYSYHLTHCGRPHRFLVHDDPFSNRTLNHHQKQQQQQQQQQQQPNKKMKTATIPFDESSSSTARRRKRRREFYLEISDNGIGIEKNALEKYIGTHSCSSSATTTIRDPSTTNSVPGVNASKILEYYNTTKGESLKSLACLCLEMKITVRAREDWKTVIHPTQRDYHHRTECNVNTLVTYNKILRQGVSDVSFHTIHPPVHYPTDVSKHYTNKSSTSSDGTTVTLYGLFYNQGVRRQQYESVLHSRNSNAGASTGHIEKWKEVKHARGILSQYAIAFPSIIFRLILVTNQSTTDNENPWAIPSMMKEDTVWNDHNHSTTHSAYPHKNHSNNTCPYIQKLLQLLGDNEKDLYSFISIEYDSQQCYKDGPIQHGTTTRIKPKRLFQGSTCGIIKSNNSMEKIIPFDCWRLVGALAIPQQTKTSSTTFKQDYDFDASSTNGFHNQYNLKKQSSRRIEYFFINSRPVKNYQFQNLLQTLYYDNQKINIPLILHLFCPESLVDIVIDDQHSFVSLSRNQTQIENFIQQALDNHLKMTTVYDMKENHVRQDSRSLSHRIMQKTSRLIFTHGSVPTCKDKEEFTISDKPYKETSPFDDAFISDQSVKDITESCMLFNNEDEFKSFDSFQGTLAWTRERIQSSLSNINVEKPFFPMGILNIQRGLLKKAKFIAQIDKKFLLTEYDGNICLIDQHAADERIGLEKLEQAILSVVRGIIEKDTSVTLRKLGTIHPSNIIQSRPLEGKYMELDITASQGLAIKAHEEVIRTWKFDFQLLDSNKVRVLSIPQFCGRKLASPQDFLQFVDELSDPSCMLPILQSIPLFVNRYLSSLACRYALMFGDLLSDEQSQDILDSLSQCEMPNVCAHGRPSIVSILNSMDDRWKVDIPYFRRKRVIR